MCQPWLATGAALRMPGTAGGMVPSLASLPVHPLLLFAHPAGRIQMYECGRECSGVRVECQEEPLRCRGLTCQRCRVPPWLPSPWRVDQLSPSLGMHHTLQGQPRHIPTPRSPQEGNSERSESCFHCFYGKKQGVSSSSFFFFPCKISHFSQLKENQFYFVMCLTREVPWPPPSWQLLGANP